MNLMVRPLLMIINSYLLSVFLAGSDSDDSDDEDERFLRRLASLDLSTYLIQKPILSGSF
jgi:hypothetical protein